MQKDPLSVLMLIAKGTGAAVYSVVHAVILLLLAWAIVLLFAQVVALHWVWIVLIMLFLWGMVSAFRSFAITFLLMPYRYFASDTFLVLILPAICIVLAVVLFLIGFWNGLGSLGWKEFLCGLFITYECAMLIWQSLVGMFVVCRADSEQ